MDAKSRRAIYERWLLECVFIHGWSTYKCAMEIKAKPKDVLRDFNEICQRLNSESKNNPKRKR
jgi:hypothetical protein